MVDIRVKKKNESNRELARKIAEAIKASDMSATEIAAQCKVTPQAVSGWKTTGRISKDMLSIFAEIVKVPLASFLSASGPPTKAKTLKFAVLPKNRDLVSAEEIIELIAMYRESTDEGRRKIRDLANLTPKVAGTRKATTSNET